MTRADKLLAAVLLAASAGAVLAWTRIANFERQSVLLRNARGMPLRVLVFEPRRAPRPMPAVVVCQPVNSPPEAGQALILEFVRHGMLAVTFDFRGRSRDENRVLLRENILAVTALDAAAVLRYLSGRPDVDPQRIGIIGHSFGGTLAIRAATEQPQVRTTVAVGIAGDVTKTAPRNLLWLVGLYDEFRPLSEMQAVMEASNDEAVSTIEQTTGNFARGTARRLEVTATADHFTEFLNHGTAVRAVAWFESAFSGRPVTGPRVAAAPWFYACYSLAFLSGWLFLVRRAFLRSVSPRVFTSAMAALLLAFIFMPLPKLAIFRADLALWGLALLIAVNARARPGRGLWWPVLAWGSFVLTLIVNQAAYFWRYPHLLLSLPLFPFWHATGVLNSYLFIYPRGLLMGIPYDGGALHPSWAFWVLVAAEVFQPGIIGQTAGKVIHAAMGLRAGRSAGRTRWVGYAVVAALVAVLAVLVWIRAAQGFIDRDSLRLAGWVILRFAILPFLIFSVLKRHVRYSASLP